MNLRWISICLLIAFLLCYLEWGGGNSGFLFQMEYKILNGKSSWSDTFAHPAVLLPFCGQLLFLTAAIQRKPGKKFILCGIILSGLLIAFVFLIGILSLNYKILLSTIPFLLISAYFIMKYKSFAVREADKRQ